MKNSIPYTQATIDTTETIESNENHQYNDDSFIRQLQQGELKYLLSTQIGLNNIYAIIYQQTIQAGPMDKTKLEKAVQLYISTMMQNKDINITNQKTIATQIVAAFNNFYSRVNSLDYSSKAALQQSIEDLLAENTDGLLSIESKREFLNICKEAVNSTPETSLTAAIVLDKIYMKVKQNYIYSAEKYNKKAASVSQEVANNRAHTAVLAQKIANMSTSETLSIDNIEELFIAQIKSNFDNLFSGDYWYQEPEIISLILMRLANCTAVNLNHIDIGSVAFQAKVNYSAYAIDSDIYDLTDRKYEIIPAMVRARDYLAGAAEPASYTILAPICWNDRHWCAGVIEVSKTAANQYNIKLKYQDPFNLAHNSNKNFHNLIKQLSGRIFGAKNVTVDNTFSKMHYVYQQKDYSACGVLTKEMLVNEITLPDKTVQAEFIKNDSVNHGGWRKADIDCYSNYIDNDSEFFKDILREAPYIAMPTVKPLLANAILDNSQQLLQQLKTNGKKISPAENIEVSPWKIAKIILIASASFAIAGAIGGGLALGIMAILPNYVAFISTASIAITAAVASIAGAAASIIGATLVIDNNATKFYEQAKHYKLNKDDFSYKDAVTKQVNASEIQH